MQDADGLPKQDLIGKKTQWTQEQAAVLGAVCVESGQGFQSFGLQFWNNDVMSLGSRMAVLSCSLRVDFQMAVLLKVYDDIGAFGYARKWRERPSTFFSYLNDAVPFDPVQNWSFDSDGTLFTLE